MDLSELFWNSSVADLKRGYIEDESGEGYICLVCGRRFEKGLVYPDQGLLYEAERYVRLHVTNEHDSMFDFLLGMNRKFTGLTDLQKKLLELFRQGLSDQEIAREMGGSSPSTIRNHRFSLRERKKQAKIFLAIMELLEEEKKDMSKFVEVHRSAAMVDERFAITEEENAKYLKTYFKEGPEGPLAVFPSKEKRKVIVLRHILKRFEPEKVYSEKEVNDILRQVFDDYVTLRRYLIEYGFMDRAPDGSAYWVKK